MYSPFTLKQGEWSMLHPATASSLLADPREIPFSISGSLSSSHRPCSVHILPRPVLLSSLDDLITSDLSCDQHVEEDVGTGRETRHILQSCISVRLCCLAVSDLQLRCTFISVQIVIPVLDASTKMGWKPSKQPRTHPRNVCFRPGYLLHPKIFWPQFGPL